MVAYRYAQLNAANICIADSTLNAAILDPKLIPLAADEPSRLGLQYDNGNWHAVADEPSLPLPKVLVTHIHSDDPAALLSPDLDEVTVAIGSNLTVSAELRDPTGTSVQAVSAVFRMPLIARDGRERYLLAEFVEGVAQIGTILNESGCWQIDAATINRDLPAEQHMQFDGLRIFVLQ